MLAEQIERSSGLEQKLLRVLAVAREPVSLAESWAHAFGRQQSWSQSGRCAGVRL